MGASWTHHGYIMDLSRSFRVEAASQDFYIDIAAMGWLVKKRFAS